MFKILRPLIHQLPAEAAHRAGICAVAAGLVPACHTLVQDTRLQVNLAGLALPNPVGLAAGFDKNAETLGHIFKYGFGFVECGTVTPKPQAGNPKPRMFRVSEQEAVVNRLGFNNDGMEPYVARLKVRKAHGIVGANIGKNKDSEDAVADYVTLLHAVYAHADYITVNISSPNTVGLRDLQAKESLAVLVKAVHAARAEQMAKGQPRKPVFVKIAPDLDQAQREDIAQLALEQQVDALIVGNTTITRPDMPHVPEHLQQGGLSGKPLMPLSTQVLKSMYQLTQGKIPLIGVGGISSAADAYAKIRAGATAVQLYTALAYQGFGLINTINSGVLTLMERDGATSLSELIGKDA